MPLQMPRAKNAPSDRTHGCIVEIVPYLIGDLLCLPAGQGIVSASVRPRDGVIEFIVEGAGLPEIEGGKPRLQSLLIHKEVRNGDTGVQQARILASWNHDPETKWVIHDWSAA